MSEQKYYAVYQVGGPIYGYGTTEEKAITEAKQWVDEKSIDEDGDLDLDTRNNITGNLCCDECTVALYNKVKSEDGDIQYEADCGELHLSIELQDLNTRQEISETTGFDRGEKFDSPNDVREYFTEKAMTEMGFTNDLAQSELNGMADDVVEHHWHCNF